MAAKYDLQPNEAILCQFDRVSVNSKMASFTDEIILTNLNLIHVSKGLLGNTKGINKYPVKQIKIHDNQAQAIMIKDSSGFYSVDVHFINDHLRIRMDTKKNARKLTDEISILLVGEPAKTNSDIDWALPGTEVIAETIKDTVDTFKGVFGFNMTGTSNSRSESKPETVTIKCVGCHASITGSKGKTVRCRYCDTKQLLK